MTEAEVEGIARHLATFLCPDALLDAKDVGALLKCSARHVLAWHAKSPGFPDPVRLNGPDGQVGHPRWLRKDITSWINSHVVSPEPVTRLGRRRKAAAW